MSKSSIPKFTSNPSGGEFSERRWESPHKNSMNASQLMRRAGSLSPRDENKSPFQRSGRGSIEDTRSSIQHIAL